MTTGAKASYLETIVQAVDELREELVETSMDIHAHPELNYEERHAAAVLADSLERHGFKVERGVGGVETARRWPFWPNTTPCRTLATAVATT